MAWTCSRPRSASAAVSNHNRTYVRYGPPASAVSVFDRASRASSNPRAEIGELVGVREGRPKTRFEPLVPRDGLAVGLKRGLELPTIALHVRHVVERHGQVPQRLRPLPIPLQDPLAQRQLACTAYVRVRPRGSPRRASAPVPASNRSRATPVRGRSSGRRRNEPDPEAFTKVSWGHSRSRAASVAAAALTEPLTRGRAPASPVGAPRTSRCCCNASAACGGA